MHYILHELRLYAACDVKQMIVDWRVIEGLYYGIMHIASEFGSFTFLLFVCVDDMTTIKDSHLARLDMETRLRAAIDNWRPDRPRRWLAKYGNVVAEGRNPLADQYRILRCEAERLLRRSRTKQANGLASHLLHLE